MAYVAILRSGVRINLTATDEDIIKIRDRFASNNDGDTMGFTQSLSFIRISEIAAIMKEA
jgi:hypothetical protein